VRYTAKDAAGNENTCVFVVTVNGELCWCLLSATRVSLSARNVSPTSV
jgi:hypothetical protein